MANFSLDFNLHLCFPWVLFCYIIAVHALQLLAVSILTCVSVSLGKQTYMYVHIQSSTTSSIPLGFHSHICGPPRQWYKTNGNPNMPTNITYIHIKKIQVSMLKVYSNVSSMLKCICLVNPIWLYIIIVCHRFDVKWGISTCIWCHDGAYSVSLDPFMPDANPLISTQSSNQYKRCWYRASYNQIKQHINMN